MSEVKFEDLSTVQVAELTHKQITHFALVTGKDDAEIITEIQRCQRILTDLEEPFKNNL